MDLETKKKKINLKEKDDIKTKDKRKKMIKYL